MIKIDKNIPIPFPKNTRVGIGERSEMTIALTHMGVGDSVSIYHSSATKWRMVAAELSIQIMIRASGPGGKGMRLWKIK